MQLTIDAIHEFETDSDVDTIDVAHALRAGCDFERITIGGVRVIDELPGPQCTNSVPPPCESDHAVRRNDLRRRGSERTGER